MPAFVTATASEIPFLSSTAVNNMFRAANGHLTPDISLYQTWSVIFVAHVLSIKAIILTDITRCGGAGISAFNFFFFLWVSRKETSEHFFSHLT